MIPVSPRQTRLLRTPHLASFRDALVDLATGGPPLAARDRLVVVPTRAAAEQLVRSVQRRRAPSGGAVILPDFITAGELIDYLAMRLPMGAPALTDAERETLMGVACRAAADGEYAPPFRLRPGLISEILGLYDALRRHQKSIDTFERLALGRLEPGAELDRGAARLVQQTHFLVAAFRIFEQRSRDAGSDEHQLRARLLDEAALRPYRHIIVAVGDRAFDPYGLYAADWDLLARLPGLERLDVLTTDVSLAGAPHERMHQLLPGIEEVRLETPASPAPLLAVPDESRRFHLARDREDEIAAFGVWIKTAARAGTINVDSAALVVSQPLPYMYLARELFRSAGIPCQMFDALPLAAEPYAAAVDLVFTCVGGSFPREASMALLRSPWFRWAADDSEGQINEPGLLALDRRLAEAGYLGDASVLERLIDGWSVEEGARASTRAAVAAGSVLLTLCRELAPLREARPAAAQLDTLLAFLDRHGASPAEDDSTRENQRRARRAIHGVMVSLRDAFARFDDTETTVDDVAALVRRAIEQRTFAPRAGESGVHVLDPESARFGDFEVVQLAGLIDGEWPGRSKRSIFYGPEILRELGWPSEVERRDAARARFVDLLRLPSSTLRVSAFSLESDAVVSVSPLLSDLETAGLTTTTAESRAVRIFEHEALSLNPPVLDAVSPIACEWARHRQRMATAQRRSPGQIDSYSAPSYSLSALERYQDCGFKFFAANVLRLEEAPEDQSSLTPRRRGQLLHEILHRFFATWDGLGEGSISTDNLERAQEVFAAVAEPIVATLPESDAALERTRLFGSAISVGVADVVLMSEAVRTEPVDERWLEYRLEGQFTLGGSAGRPVSLRGIADRIDLLPGRRLRVIDYKSGAVPAVTRALQAPIYALCAQERLTARDGQPWHVEEAAYVGLASRRPVIPVVSADAGDAEKRAALADARARLLAVVDGIGRGSFPPRPYDTMICRSCAFSTVCRKEYAADE